MNNIIKKPTVIIKNPTVIINIKPINNTSNNKKRNRTESDTESDTDDHHKKQPKYESIIKPKITNQKYNENCKYITNKLTLLIQERQHQHHNMDSPDKMHDNIFQPNSTDITRLTEICQEMKTLLLFQFSELTMTEWFLFLKNNRKILSLEPQLPHVINKFYLKQQHLNFAVWTDRQTRVKHMVDTIIKYNKKHIVLLDGHGRIVLELLFQLYNRKVNLDEYTITLCELDNTVHEWHKLFFPTSITKKQCNVFNYLNDMQPDHIKNTFVYLNFCGISKSVDNLFKLLATPSWKKEPILISYATRKCKDADRLSRLADKTISNKNGQFITTFTKNNV